MLRSLARSLVLALSAALMTVAPLGAPAAQLDSATASFGRLISADPVDRVSNWPEGHYFRVVFSGIASDTIIVNGYRADVVMLDNSSTTQQHYAIARLPDDAMMTRGFITFMVTAKTAFGYTPAVPLKIVI
jgi:hypothetical protein